MSALSVSSRPASLLFGATVVVTVTGTFLGIFFLFSDIPLSIRIVTALIVGVVGVLSFIRHSLFFRSDQLRMGWTPDHPLFQIEVGFANLAIGIGALTASILDWGYLACGMALLIYGLYLLCTLVLHIYIARTDPAQRKGAPGRIMNTAFFVFVLLIFAAIAFLNAGS